MAELDEPVLDADEIQGNVLPGFNTRFQRLLGLRIADIEGSRAWLSQIVSDISTLRDLSRIRHARRVAARRQAPRPQIPTLLNVTFSNPGLRRLIGDAADSIAEPWFKAGMWQVAGSLGDDPRMLRTWKLGGSDDTTPDVLAILGDDDRDELDDRSTAMRALAEQRGLEVCFDQSGAKLDEDREHFGFRDGISVPAVRGRLPGNAPEHLYRRYIAADDPLAQRFAKPGQVLLWPGQAVFGYAAQDPRSVLDPGPVAQGGADWMRNGSFLVFRRLRQDVPAFERFLAEQAEIIRARTGSEDVDEERVAALIVGRWRDGTPLTRNPEHADRFDQLSDNHFAYLSQMPSVRVERNRRVVTVAGAPSDLDGLLCPRMAHIRKVNPRDAPTDMGDEAHTLALQIFRRGIPFGRPVAVAPDRERGLLFLAYTTAIEQRFGTLHVGWMNSRDAAERGKPGFDLLAGQNEPGAPRDAQLTVDGHAVQLSAAQTWVTATGGGFFFSPSVSMIGQLGRGETPSGGPEV